MEIQFRDRVFAYHESDPKVDASNFPQSGKQQSNGFTYTKYVSEFTSVNQQAHTGTLNIK